MVSVDVKQIVYLLTYPTAGGPRWQTVGYVMTNAQLRSVKALILNPFAARELVLLHQKSLGRRVSRRGIQPSANVHFVQLWFS